MNAARFIAGTLFAIVVQELHLRASSAQLS